MKATFSPWPNSIYKFYKYLYSADMRKFVFTFLVLLVTLTSCTSTSTSSDSLETSDNTSSDDSSLNVQADTSWIPAGFYDYDGNIAWRWIERQSDCSDCIYWHVQVITNFGCPNGVYASINISKNNEVIDWTNDSIPYLGSGQKAVLAFEKYGLSGSPSSYRGELTELNCR